MTEMLREAGLYLLAMVIAVPLARRFGLGSVLGYLVAGIVIGPLLGLAAPYGEELQYVGEFGIVLMLFLIGLEVDPTALWTMRRRLFGMGGLQLALTSALVAAIGIGLHLGPQRAVTVGLILSLSSTAIVLQTLSEKRLLQTAGGKSAFAVLLAQDIAVIPILAALPLLAVAGHGDGASLHDAGNLLRDLPAWAAPLVTLGAVGAVIAAGHLLVRPAFGFVHLARQREIETAFALVLVVGIALLMNAVGLSPALGSFVAGVMLANSEFRHQLEADIAPFKGLLMGLFFITVGIDLNLTLFLDRPANLVALTLALMVVKGLVLYVVGSLFGLRARDRWLFTLGLAQAGEFGLALGAFALAQSVLPAKTSETLALVITLSMMLSPLFFVAYELLSRWIKEARPVQSDPIDEQNPIIIAGVGRFGQVVNRMLSQSGFPTTILDQDFRTIEVLRTFGFKGFVGDPTRPDTLAAAGIATARVLAICLDDKRATVELVRYVRRIRPDIPIIVRARDREHVYQLYEAGATDIVREYFDSSLRVARYALEKVGVSEFEASELQKLFFDLDRAAVRDLAQLWKPGVPAEKNPAYVARARELNKDLEESLLGRFATAEAEGAPAAQK